MSNVPRAEPTTMLVRGRAVVCRVVDRNTAVVVEDGALAVHGGRITEVGRFGDLVSRYSSAEVVGSPNDVVMPGLVNAHHHVGLTPFQLGSSDLPLELWSTRRIAERSVDPYLDTLYSAFELVESGVTAVQHLHRGASAGSGPGGVLAVADSVLRAYADVGMRVSFSLGIRDQNYLAYVDDDAFIGTLPPELAADTRAFLEPRRRPIEEQLGNVAALAECLALAPQDLVRFQVAPTNVVWCSDRSLVRAFECARQYGMRLNIHVLETSYQREWARRTYGVSPVRHLSDLGLLGPDTTLSHAVWLTEEDIELVASSGTTVCHNASSNLRLRSGLAPIVRLAERGVEVAIGIDEAGINDDRDMLQEMRLVLSQQQMPRHGGEGLTAPQVLQMATEGGATSTGYGQEIGVLEPGRSADLVLLDWTRIQAPHLDPEVPLIDAIVRRGRPSMVKTVMVAGRVIYDSGVYLQVDRHVVLEELDRALRRDPGVDDVARARLAVALLPHVRRFYAGWSQH